MSFLQKIKNIPLIRIFSIIVLISFVIWIISLLTGNGNPMFFGSKKPCDNLFDDYKCLTSAVYNLLPYETLYPYAKAGYSYPPNGYLFFAFWGNVINSINPFDISNTELLFAAFYLIFCSSSLFLLIFNFMNKFKTFDKYIFCMAILASGTFLFACERANMVLLTLLFLTFFIFYHNSENKILKELAIISLALAVSFKISPAVFGMLLLWNKDFKAIFRLIFYSVILFIVPSLFYPGGLEVIRIFSENLSMISSFIVDTFSVSGIGKSFFNKIILTNFGGNLAQVNNLTTFYISLTGLTSLLTTFFFKEKWKKVYLLVFLMTVVPAVSYSYVLIYFIPVMILYFMEENHSKSDLLFTIWFAIMFLTGTSWQLGSRSYYFVQEFALWAAFIQIFIYGIYMMFKNFKQIAVKDFAEKKITLFKALRNSKLQANYVKKKLTISLKLTGLSVLILLIGIYMYGANYTFWQKSFKNITAPTIIKCGKTKIKDDFRLTINTTFIAKQTNKEQILFQTDKDNKGIQLKQYPDMTITLEYPISDNEIEKYIFSEKLKPDTIYNIATEITNQSISPLLSEYKFKKRSWKAFKEKPYRQKISQKEISEIIIGRNATKSARIKEFYILLKNGNNTNFLVIITLLGTFLPLFAIVYNRQFRKFIKRINKK